MDPNTSAGYYQPQPPVMQPGQPTYPPGQVPMTTMPPPQQQQTTVVIAGQPQSTNILQNTREWSHGLCACCEDLGECCYAFWCPPCYWCSLAGRMDEYYCGPYYFPCGCFELFRVGMRTKLRAMNGIRGSICDDAVCVVCCPCCVAVQMGQELKYHRLA